MAHENTASTKAKPAQPATRGEISDQEMDKVSGGSQSTGAGAGKVTFNPFSITRKVDKSSPIFL